MSDNTTNSTPPLDQHPQHGRSTTYLATTLLGLLLPHTACTIFIIARIWTRFLISRKWHIDDTLTIAAWLCATAVCTVYSMSIVKPSGSLLNDYLLHTYIGLVCYQLSLCLAQLSVLFLYLRVVRHRRLVWITIAAVVAHNIPLLWTSAMQCYPAASPPQLFGRPVAFCFAFKPLLIASASLHAATYIWLIGLAARTAFNRDSLPRRLRLVLVGIFSLSVCVIAAGLARLLLGLHSHQGSIFIIVTILECDIATICASAVSLRPLLVWFRPPLDLDEDNNNLAGSTPRYRDSTARRSIFRPRMSMYNLRQHSDSSDLTSVVSYHGYPWTQNHTPARSKTNVAVGAGGQASSGVFTHDTIVSQATVAPSLAQPPPALSALQPGTAAPSDPPPGALTRRPSSTFFDTADDFAQYFPEYTPQPKSSATCSAKGKRAAIGLGISLAPRGTSRNRNSTGSQESFVMGLNDPASPARLTRLARASGYSGETYAAGGCDDDELRMKSKGDEYVAKTQGQAVKSSKNTETSFLDDTESEGDTEAAEAAEAKEAKEAKEDTLKKS